MRSLTKKSKAIIAGAAIAGLASTGVAYAYWTTGGTGDGSATNASTNGVIVLTAHFANGLTPGGTTPVTYTAANAGTSNLFVGTITNSLSIDAAHVTAGCLIGDFGIDATTLSNTVVPAGATATPLVGTSTLSFANTTDNQNGCKGAIVTDSVTSN